MMKALRLLLCSAFIAAQTGYAFAGAGTITSKDASGVTKTWDVITDGSGNFVATTGICDQAAAATCASVGTAGSPSTNALTVQAVTLGHGVAANAMRVELPTDGTGVIAGVTTVSTVTNLAQMNGAALLMGNGVTGTGSQRVTIASDNTAFSVKNLGNAGAVLDFAGQNASSPANSWLTGCQFNTTPTTITSGNASPCQLDNAGNLLVNVKAATGLAQGSTTSGQTGSMVMGAVTTAPPTYTTAQTAYVSLTTNGSTRVLPTSQYPDGAIPYTASATGTTAATTATLTGAASVTTYLCGFSIRANATAAATGNIYARDVTSAHMRSGGQFSNNLWTNNNSGGDFGRPKVGTTYSLNHEVFSELLTEPVSPVTISSVTVASPAIFNSATNNGRSVGEVVAFITTGVLPTPLVSTTGYVVRATGLTTTTFQVADSAGTPIAVSDAGTGTLSVVNVDASVSGWTIKLIQQYNAYTTNFAAAPVSLTNSVFSNSHAPQYNGFAAKLEQGGGGFSTPANATINNNVIYLWNYGPSAFGSHDTIWDVTSGTSNVLTPNDIYLGSGVSYNNVNPAGYLDPTRTVGSYNATISGCGSLPGGCTATIAAFMTSARAQSKDNWNNALMAGAVNNYIRAGLNMAAYP